VKHINPYNLSERILSLYSLLFAVVTELDGSLAFRHPLYIDGIWWQHLALFSCNSGYKICRLSLRSCAPTGYSG